MISPALTESRLTKKGPIPDAPRVQQYGEKPGQQRIPIESAGVASSANIEFIIYTTEPALTLVAPIFAEDVTWFGMEVEREPGRLAFFQEIMGSPDWEFRRELEDDDGG